MEPKSLETIQESVKAGSAQVQDMIDSIVTEQTKQLDMYIDQVRTLFASNTPIADADLERILVNIPTEIYHLTTIMQQIDVQKGISAENAKYYENESLINATGTVAEKQAKANNATIKDRVVQLAYKNAASLIQAKFNAAMEILSSARKIQNRRLEEMKLTKMAGSAASF